MAFRVFAAGLMAALVVGNAPARAEEGAACATPRFSDVGWTDISATTALAGLVLENLGYKPKVDILSVAVTFEALPRGDVDVSVYGPVATDEQDAADALARAQDIADDLAIDARRDAS